MVKFKKACAHGLLTVGVVSVSIAGMAGATRIAGPPAAPLGVFLASDQRGTDRLADFESWLGAEVSVGRTYIPGDSWEAILGPQFILTPWTQWLAAKPERTLALNVPMITPNEGGLPDSEVAPLLAAGAGGAFDPLFKTLADKLVSAGAADTIIVLGWEMNGSTYSSRCAPNPPAWKAYWRRIVTTMRTAVGQNFRFDFAPNRGRDAIPWTECYPGDDVVDIIGMDSYDQPPGNTFAEYVEQPYGLRAHADFAAAHGKPISFPEWGLFRHGDRPEFILQMLDWIANHDVMYHSISDYCPHGVWTCPSNARSARAFRDTLSGSPGSSIPGLMPPSVSPDRPWGRLERRGPLGRPAVPAVRPVRPPVKPRRPVAGPNESEPLESTPRSRLSPHNESGPPEATPRSRVSRRSPARTTPLEPTKRKV